MSSSLHNLKALYLIIGTAIGAGILALPIATADNGFLGGISLLLICWSFMTLSGFYMLEVRLRFKHNEKADIASMALETLGRPGLILSEITYLLLLFSLMAAYILVGSSWLEMILPGGPIFAKITFTLIAAIVVLKGIFFIANINQLISIGMLTTLSLMLVAGLMHIDLSLLLEVPKPSPLTSASLIQNLPLILTAFGFAIILPSLAPYLNYSKKYLTAVIITGSIIILTAYILWMLISFGILGISGSNGLASLHNSESNGTELILALQNKINTPLLGIIAQAFVIFAVLSSLLGVGLSLFHFVKDALPKRLKNKSLSLILSFSPPLLLLILYPAAIELILNIAGLFVALILGILPSLMALSHRIQKNNPNNYKVWGGIPLILLNLTFFCLIILIVLS